MDEFGAFVTWVLEHHPETHYERMFSDWEKCGPLTEEWEEWMTQATQCNGGSNGPNN